MDQCKGKQQCREEQQNQAIALFRKHAGKDGDDRSLSKSELKELFKSLRVLDLIDLDDMMKLLDADGDGVVTLKEFTDVIQIQKK